MSHPESDSFHEETSSQQEIVGQDPWLEEFARAPYDPLISARATGRLTGLAAKRAYRYWWMRLAAFLVGLGMVSAAVGTAYVSIRGLSIGPGPLIIEIPFALVGARLIWSAVRRS
jgi:hypothetical protein